MGIQARAGRPSMNDTNSGGMTPTMVAGEPLTRSASPTTSARPEK
jgi:hypothetical protein